MVTILVTTGIAIGLNMSGFTFLGELMQSGTFLEAPWLILFIISWCVTCSCVLLFVTNFVVSIYDHLDVMPIFYSLCMIFEVIAGLTILGESDRYSAGALVGVAVGVIITVSGILILGWKKTAIERKEKQTNH